MSKHTMSTSSSPDSGCGGVVAVRAVPIDRRLDGEYAYTSEWTPSRVDTRWYTSVARYCARMRISTEPVASVFVERPEDGLGQPDLH